MKIGIDIGNVIIGGGGDDTSFFDDSLWWNTPEVDGAYLAIESLKKDNEIHLISKCGLKVENRSILWLAAKDYIPMVLQHRIHFVRKRHLKAPMAQALELDIFIDDRQDIIDTMQGVVKFPILFTSWEETDKQLEEIFDSTQG